MMVPEIRRYGCHRRHLMAVWRPQGESSWPAVLWFHGGGFNGGDHLQIPVERPALANELGLAFLSATYRLRADNPTLLDILMDGALALQYTRYRAGELGIDPDRIAVAGGSAGGHIAGWLAYHSDLADARHENVVRRQSTRVAVVGLVNTQPTPLDPETCIRCLQCDRILVEKTIGRYLEERAAEQLAEVWFKEPFYPENFETAAAFTKARNDFYRECSVFEQADGDAPPTFFVTQDVAPSAEILLRDDTGGPAAIDLHHPALMLMLKNKLEALGVETVWSCSFDDMLRYFAARLGASPGG